ncbi:MAG TPA: 1,4-dihydroxy-2-naphthoate polyprenyltransferase [Candidatus Nanopelagicales bacterium]|nr:1,4-dihydroxy-2-naphthoate polyprenyltransferase [Candidatus Nanopelagicales bacterium]
MATFGQWVEGARPRTLPAAVAPVIVGTAAAYFYLAEVLDSGAPSDNSIPGLLLRSTSPLTRFSEQAPGDASTAYALSQAHACTSWGQFVLRALLALVVALALQVGVNYSNDYSDGIRGTDEIRVGPVRLVGQGLAPARQVKYAAFACFGVAAVAGLVLVLLTQAWWLLLVGVAAIVAAWFYTGGPRPYGYAGLGELFVFVFFGLVAVAGSTFVQTLTITATSVAGGVACGALSVAILLANNLRDIPTDILHGKRTLAVRLGDPGTRTAYLVAVAAPFLVAVAIAIPDLPWALLGLLAIPLAVRPVRAVRGGAVGRDLIPVLAGTGRLLLAYSVALGLGLVLAAVTA